MILGVVSLLLALTFGGKDYAWDSWQIIGLFALAVIVSLALLLLKRKLKSRFYQCISLKIAHLQY